MSKAGVDDHAVNHNAIAIFLPNLNGGGAERVMVTLANAFAQRGYMVDLVLASKEGPYLEDVSSAVRIVDLKVGRVFKALLPLARYMRNDGPSVILSAMQHANVVAILARIIARRRVKLVVSERTTISIAYQKSAGIASWVIFKLVRALYSKADEICSVSKASSIDLAHFLNLPESRIKTIYNPFDLEEIAVLAAKPICHPWFLPDSPPVLLAVGRLTEAKDYPSLIRAFAILRKRMRARLLILGEGELREDLKLLVKECGLTEEDVQLPGFESNPFAFMSRCRLFVLSSQWEGLPGVLIQAMACRAPIISTNCLSGPDEILEGGLWGRLVPVGDINALAEAMEEVINTPRELLPDTYNRANDFALDKSVDAHLAVLLGRHHD